MKSVTTKPTALRPFELLLPQDQINRRVRELARQITEDYAGESPVLIGVLKGCMVFLPDLMRHIKLPVEVEFIAATSYRIGMKREDDIVFIGGFSSDLKNRHVLIVEGIVDSGRTASLVISRLRKMEPASVEVVTLLDKPGCHRTKIDLKYKGFSVGNDFVIGFGLDNAQSYRNLPFIGRLIDR
ncbi:MAG TPA: hypoxanthine phosphoribosyltransferase [Candidatus Acidoferrum sp.]|nr:hypoxanthine phosphoribosyltransferase [Candidatus Acidoferrum sp.]